MLDQDGHVLAALAQRRQGDLEDVEAEVEVLAEAPFLISALRSRLVAHSTRTSTSISVLPPSRRSRPSSSTRSSLACSSMGISPISSRKSVPPWASSKTPGRRWSAPVKAPRSWPKSSLSMRVAGMEAQLMATNGLSRRGERLWMARATISLPVPDSRR